MSKNLFETSLLDTAPPSITSDPQIVAACKALDAEFLAVSNCIREVITIGDIDGITDERLLDIIAQQLHVDWWQDILTGGQLSIDKKKALIKASLEWHSHKGTKWIVEEMLHTVMGDAFIAEWYQYTDRPAPRSARYRFRIGLGELPPDQETWDRLVEAVYSVKNARSWLESIGKIMDEIPVWVYVGILGYAEVYFDVQPYN